MDQGKKKRLLDEKKKGKSFSLITVQETKISSLYIFFYLAIGIDFLTADHLFHPQLIIFTINHLIHSQATGK